MAIYYLWRGFFIRFSDLSPNLIFRISRNLRGHPVRKFDFGPTSESFSTAPSGGGMVCACLKCSLADLGGVARHTPLRVQILSFQHTKFSKRNCLGSPRPLYGKSWIRHWCLCELGAQGSCSSCLHSLHPSHFPYWTRNAQLLFYLFRTGYIFMLLDALVFSYCSWRRTTGIYFVLFTASWVNKTSV